MLLRAFGNTLVAQEELISKTRDRGPRLEGVGAAVHSGNGGRAAESVQFTSGEITAGGVLQGLEALQPVGLGRPASIIIRHVYTGRFPRDSFWHGKTRKDMLLTSAIRDPYTTFNMAPRAINLTKRRLAARTDIIGPDAPEDGTPLVYYSPAVTSQSLTVTFDLAFDDFPDELVGKIAQAVSAAGSIPVFGPYSGVLIGAGTAIKLISSLANALTDSTPDFSATERLDFDMPDAPIPAAGHYVLCTPSFDHSNYRFELNKGLVSKAGGTPYNGDEPYLVFLLDGGKKESFEKFSPTAASAALLSRFLSQKEGSEVLADTVIDAVKLYNDMRFRTEADRLQAQIAQLPAASGERVRLEERRKALVANILSDVLKPAGQ